MLDTHQVILQHRGNPTRSGVVTRSVMQIISNALKLDTDMNTSDQNPKLNSK